MMVQLECGQAKGLKKTLEEVLVELKKQSSGSEVPLDDLASMSDALD
jgi:hypothetical protein